MIFNDKTASQVAKYLLEKEAVILRPDDPFTWASGWKSPIYCDNRVLLSYPEVRTFVKDKFADLISSVYSDVEMIVGVATAGISHAALIADKLGLPMSYGRTKGKDHGRKNVIEGRIEKGQKTVVIEDLISTGGSSLQIVQTVLDVPAEVRSLLAIFTYDFAVADEKFREMGIEYYTLSDYNVLVEEALKMSYISESDVELLKEWRKNPSEWGV